MEVERINVLSVPVDIIKPEQIENHLLAMLEKPGAKQIVFLSIWDLIYARTNKEFYVCLESADLIIPVSKSILSGAKFLKKNVPIRYNPFSAIISILTVLDNHFKSLYLLGSHKTSLMQAERNVRSTFPNLQIVGRYVGFYPKETEKDIVSAIYKASPSLVLIGSGVKGKILWVYRRRNSFNSSVFLWNQDVLEIFSKRKNRVSEKTFNKSREIWVEISKNPLKVFLIFPYIWYWLTLIVWRISKKESKKNNKLNDIH